MAKGIDTTFMTYGIRREDMALIRQLAMDANLDEDWVVEYILKEYHDKRVANAEVKDSDADSVIKNAIKKIK
ncbi:MAG: hypothetical protein KBT32_09930 [Bacteroidales bacterium]|nr:hypothetical protein [Candidatus Physcocola equi]